MIFTIDIIAQVIGIIAIIFNVVAYVQKNKSTILILRFCGSLAFAISFFMLGAVLGGMLNVLGAFCSAMNLKKEKFRADHPLWLVFFFTLYAVSYFLTFTVFEKDFTLFNALIELLPVIGMVAITLGFRSKNAKTVRRFAYVSSPCWLIYNICNFAVGAILCEVFSLITITIGLIRYDLKKTNED